MSFEDYKILVYRNQPWGWVAEIPALPACYALMETPSEAIQELEGVFAMVEEDFREKNLPLPLDTTEVVPA